MRGEVCGIVVFALVAALIVFPRPALAAADPGWGTPAIVETENAGDALYPQVAVDPAGNAVAVWRQFDGLRNNTWANRFVPGVGWGTPTLIEADNTGDAFDPQVAVDSAGNAVAVWRQWDGVRFNLWANRFVPGVGWGTPTLVEADNTDHVYSTAVAVDPAGNAIAVWYQWTSGAGLSIWANRFVPGGGWGTPTLIEMDNSGNAYNPQVGVDSAGNAIAAWQIWDGARFNIWANRFVPGIGWGTPVLIEADNAGDAYSPQVGVDPQGTAVVVWVQSDGSRLNIWANRFVPGIGWGTATLIETDNVGNAQNPQVAVDPAGNAVVVWQQLNVQWNIWANRFVPGIGWGTPTLIEADNFDGAQDPQVAVDSAGNAIAVWTQWTASAQPYRIWANRFVPGVGWGPATLLETVATLAHYPQVAVDPTGNAIGVWQRWDGSRYNIAATRYVVADSDGDGLTDIAEANVYGTNPERPDTDDDRLTDGQEVRTYRTPPTDPDADDDSLFDGDEVFLTRTNPLNADTDGGGAPDGWEVRNRLDPLADWDEGADPDTDRLDNLAEYVLGTDPHDEDTDGDGVSDSADAFPMNPSEYQDTDRDGVGNNADSDDDNDGVPDLTDAFPLNPAESRDWDRDGVGDNADLDDDNDGVPDASDAFPLNPSEHRDTDGDGIGDNADPDDDNDGVPDLLDAFPLDPAESRDTDGDGIGDNADTDDDGDGVPDATDAFPLNPGEWNDADGDGIGDNTDPDDDGDGVPDMSDAFPLDPAESRDWDGDGLGDNADTDDDNDGAPDLVDDFPLNPLETTDTDGDGVGDVADPDDDGDGVPDVVDAFPINPAESRDWDRDGVGDNADIDDDNDGAPDAADDFPLNPSESRDTDGDGIGDNADWDDDGDGWGDVLEIQAGSNPLSAASRPPDLDSDGMPDILDPDDDGDGVADTTDAFPTDPAEWLDTDRDGIGNNADTDDDDDGIPDASDPQPLVPNQQVVVPPPPQDFDGDGLNDSADSDDDNDGVPDASDLWPLNPNEWADTDGDGIGNNADADDDGDGWADIVELTVKTNPLSSASIPTDLNGNGVPDVLEPTPVTVPPDLDGDGTPDATDDDVDGDGTANNADDCPRDATDVVDTDGDRLCDNADQDDDNDGVFDVQDLYPLDASRAERVGGAPPDGSGTLLTVAIVLLAVIAGLLGLQMRSRGGPRREEKE